jgi:acyl dehydratase
MANVRYFEDVKVGDEIPRLTKDPVTETQLVRYAGASGDFNPIHTVHRIGEEAGFGGVIAHGLLIMGFVGQAITQWIPNRHLKRFHVRFMGVTRPMDVITVTGKIIQKIAEENRIECEVEARDQKGTLKVKGSFEAELPSKGCSIDDC